MTDGVLRPEVPVLISTVSDPIRGQSSPVVGPDGFPGLRDPYATDVLPEKLAGILHRTPRPADRGGQGQENALLPI